MMSHDDTDKKLEELYAKGQDEVRHLQKDRTFKKPKYAARDVMIHIAVTVMGDCEGHHVFGEQDKEIGQFAVRIPARWIQAGLTEAQCKKMFEELTLKTYMRMRLNGLVRAGQ